MLRGSLQTLLSSHAIPSISYSVAACRPCIKQDTFAALDEASQLEPFVDAMYRTMPKSVFGDLNQTDIANGEFPNTPMSFGAEVEEGIECSLLLTLVNDVSIKSEINKRTQNNWLLQRGTANIVPKNTRPHFKNWSRILH